MRSVFFIFGFVSRVGLATSADYTYTECSKSRAMVIIGTQYYDITNEPIEYFTL